MAVCAIFPLYIGPLLGLSPVIKAPAPVSATVFSPPLPCLVFSILSTSSMLGVLYSLHQFHAWCSLFSPPVLCSMFSILSNHHMPVVFYSLRQSHAWSVLQTYCRPMCSNLCTSQLPLVFYSLHQSHDW